MSTEVERLREEFLANVAILAGLVEGTERAEVKAKLDALIAAVRAEALAACLPSGHVDRSGPLTAEDVQVLWEFNGTLRAEAARRAALAPLSAAEVADISHNTVQKLSAHEPGDNIVRKTVDHFRSIRGAK